MEPYFADGCLLIEMEKGDRLAKKKKKERENTHRKKSRGAEKSSVSGPLSCMQLHQQLDAASPGRPQHSNCDIALWLRIATQCNSAQ